jgi:hypothetical protein
VPATVGFVLVIVPSAGPVSARLGDWSSSVNVKLNSGDILLRSSVAIRWSVCVPSESACPPSIRTISARSRAKVPLDWRSAKMLTNEPIAVPSNPASSCVMAPNLATSVAVPEIDGSEVMPSWFVVPPGAVSSDSAAVTTGPEETPRSVIVWV